MAVKTCKKDCTVDNKEKFMSEAGRCPWGDTSTEAGKKPGDYADRESGKGLKHLRWRSGGSEQS